MLCFEANAPERDNANAYGSFAFRDLNIMSRPELGIANILKEESRRPC